MKPAVISPAGDDGETVAGYRYLIMPMRVGPDPGRSGRVTFPPGGVMQLGLVGLGRMGGNMAARLRRRGHEVVGYSTATRQISDVTSLAELVGSWPRRGPSG